MTNSLLDIASLYIGLPDLNCIGLRVDGFVQKYDYSQSRVIGKEKQVPRRISRKHEPCS